MSSAIFAYGSLVSPASAAETLGRQATDVRVEAAILRGWRRRFSLVRDNRRCEKTFARAEDHSVPDHILALNVEPDPGGGSDVAGALIGVTEDELAKLDAREIRYERREVTGDVELEHGRHGFDRVVTFTARPENLMTVPPPGAVILDAYEREVERAFDRLGPGRLDAYRATTDPCGVERIDGVLIADEIPPGNPRRW